jgi:hypothetical protein
MLWTFFQLRGALTQELHDVEPLLRRHGEIVGVIKFFGLVEGIGFVNPNLSSHNRLIFERLIMAYYT